MNKTEAKHEAWRRGFLKWKCHPVQAEMYDLFYNAEPNSVMVWLLARQTGKSYLLAILAIEHAIRKPDSIIKLVTDTKVHIQGIFEKIFVEVLGDCPEDLKPEFKSKYQTYYFPNGSQIQLAGTDNQHYQKLRGQKSVLSLVDEAGFCSDLDEVVKSVLLPTTTHTGGKIVLASTPPLDPEHQFNHFIEEAEMAGKITKKTIYDNPLLDQAQIDLIIKSMGGVESPRFRREYLCEFIKDDSLSVLPEFDSLLEKDIVKEWPRPPYLDCYEAMDIGGRDLTFVLFGYYDFRANKIVVEDELVVDFNKPDQTIPQLVSGIEKKEEALWKNPLTLEIKQPYIRVSDIDYIVVREILSVSKNKINFTPANKDDKIAAINNLRSLLSARKVIIHPRCVNLIRHCRNVKWDSKTNRVRFARSPDCGHYDGVDALVYLVRHMIYTKNPYPANYQLDLSTLSMNDQLRHIKDSYSASPTDVYKKIFNVRTRR
jgi:phage terminase large subunit